MVWQEVCEHPNLQNLPFKIELNEYGSVLMSPVKVYHSALQGEISFFLRSMLKNGKVLAECAVATVKGTKVADVAWASRERFKLIRHETECSIAPEICIEVLSSGNTNTEIDEKRALYFDQGAKEVWVCTRDGYLHFYDPNGKLSESKMAPDFPKRIEV